MQGMTPIVRPPEPAAMILVRARFLKFRRARNMNKRADLVSNQPVIALRR